ncbi:permease-like cell division protein FtsX [Sinimarinibacterium sp. NLF-5-8]|uniref:permease-like cell division protein FtsX n=1 Tax=Sinimarinibacterium sp. NLF-5-8 TaxID=2698684 RepID=UPI00137C37C3|nr:permease-like cell division protein FtsX [Sinimarinibacterium sp. NLF-5-8]QHS08805.1 cell division protein FtsX [Sinimarinibacterium sp. NLF-5-8]
MALVEIGLERPNLLARWGQEHLRVLLFSLGKLTRTPVAASLTALVIGISLAMPAALYVAVRNLSTIGYSWQDSLQISLFLKDTVSAERGAVLAREVGNDPNVGSTQYISRDQSLAEFRERSGFGEALNVLQDNPLPAVIAINPGRNAEKQQVQQLLERLSRLPEVDVAKLDQQWMERLYAILAMADRAVGFITLLLALSVMVIIGNTIRLDIEARREEIEVMKLIGAPDSFIRRPFLYSGFWFGFGGGILAWILVSIGTLLLRGPASNLAQLYDSQYQLSGLGFGDGLTLILAGIILGWAGALISVWRRLMQIAPR